MKKIPDKIGINRNAIIIAMMLIALLGFIAYSNSINGKFIWDDNGLVSDNVVIKTIFPISKFFKNDIGTGGNVQYNFYRPVQMFSYAIDYAIHKLDVKGYHITNILLHILVALSIYWFLNILYHDNLLSLFASILFVVNPVHTEAVSYISGRADPLSALFTILCFIFYLKESQTKNIIIYILMLLSYTAALLSKEASLILPALILLYHYSFKNKINRAEFISILAMTVLYIVARITILKHIVSGTVDLDISTLFYRLPGVFVAIFNYLKILIFPFGLHMEYGYRLFSFSDPRAILGVIVLVTLLVYAFKKRATDNLTFFSIAWFFIALLPVLNLYPVNAYMAEHWLYVPSIGFFTLFAKYLAIGIKKFRIAGIAFLSCLVVFYLYLTIAQNNYWKDPVSFDERTLKFNPESASACTDLGIQYRDAGKTEEAIRLFKRAIAINDYPNAYNNLALSYRGQGKTEEAISLFKKAIELDEAGTAGMYYSNLGMTYLNVGRMEEAMDSFKKSIEVYPYCADVYNNLGTAYGRSGNPEKALSAFKIAVTLDPEHSEANLNIGMLYYRSGQRALAIKYLKKAIQLGEKVPADFINELGLDQK